MRQVDRLKGRPCHGLPFACAALLCLANAWKPAVIDDQAYAGFIPAILQNPLQPYGPPPDGFALIWYDRSQGAFTLLAPMVVPYWLALGASLFGDDLFILKLWLFPFCLLFTTALAALLRRFAINCWKPLLLATVFSPTFLPSVNLMIDLPSMALDLASVALFLSAVERQSTRWNRVISAGLLAGLSIQAKYAGVTSLTAILLIALARRRVLSGLACASIAGIIVIGWEIYLTRVYGRSHFLAHLGQHRHFLGGEAELSRWHLIWILRDKLFSLIPFAGMLGGLTPPFSLLLLVGLRCRDRIVLTVTAVLSFGFVLMLAVPNRFAVFMNFPNEVRGEVSISTILAGICGFLIVSLLLVSSAYVAFRGWRRYRPRPRWRSDGLLLVSWLAVETAATLLLSPFPAARRDMGIVVVGTLLAGHLLSLTDPTAARRAAVNWISGIGVLLGGLFAWTDFRDAMIEKRAVLDSFEWIGQQPDGSGQIWFTGHWGFHYYAVREGGRPIVPYESVLQEGDWIIYPDTRLRPYGQLVQLEKPDAERHLLREWYDRWPLRTNPDYYDGFQPIRRHEGHRLRVTIFRARKTFLALPG